MQRYFLLFLLFSGVPMVHHCRILQKRKDRFEFHSLNFMTSLTLTDKSKIFKGMLYWRIMELRTGIEITRLVLSVSLKLFSTKTNKCFMFIPPSLRYFVGAVREQKLLYMKWTPIQKCWNPLEVISNVLIFFLKENLSFFT